MICDRPADAVHREHLIVPHGELAAQIILGNARIDIVRRIDVDLALEHMRRRIGRVDVVTSGCEVNLLGSAAGLVGGVVFGGGATLSPCANAAPAQSRSAVPIVVKKRLRCIDKPLWFLIIPVCRAAS